MFGGSADWQTPGGRRSRSLTSLFSRVVTRVDVEAGLFSPGPGPSSPAPVSPRPSPRSGESPPPADGFQAPVRAQRHRSPALSLLLVSMLMLALCENKEARAFLAVEVGEELAVFRAPPPRLSAGGPAGGAAVEGVEGGGQPPGRRRAHAALCSTLPHGCALHSP